MKRASCDLALPVIKAFKTALIVDDHPLFCDALSITIKLVSDIDRLETAPDLQAALEKLASGWHPDIIFFDLNLPGVSGLEGLIRIRLRYPSIPLIVVSSESDNRTISASIAAGAAGFVPKHSHRDVFRAALGALAGGRTYLPDGYMGTGFDEKGDGAGGMDSDIRDLAERMASLTRQQSCILELVCSGKLNKQIAHSLSISEATVKAHVTAIMRKLKVHNRTQAVIVAQKVKSLGR